MEKKQPNLELYFKLPNPGLLAYFQHTVDGNQDDYRPPFWKGKSREEVLAQWQKVFDSLGVKESWPSLYEYEMEMKSKVGPMSIQLPLQERLQSIAEYFEGVVGTPTPILPEAIEETVKFFSRLKGSIRLRSVDATLAEMRLSTNSGNPWFTKRRRVVEDLKTSRVVREGDKWIAIIRGKPYELTAILGWRGQEGGITEDDVKQRVIWMMSALLNLYELRFYQPFILGCQKNSIIPAYVSMDRVDEEVTKLFDTKGADDVVICTDFTRFDQHFNKAMQDAARTVYSRLLNRSDLDWLEDIYPAKFHIPIICSKDLAFYGFHGMGSGSGGTNADECVAHKALQFEACIERGVTLNPHSMAYGDDGVLSAPGLTAEDVIRTYTKHGMVMNPDKQYVSKHDCVVLRRWHHINYRDKGIMVGVYSTFRALGRLLAQERFYDPEEWGPEQVTLRAWSILENCNHHPNFEQFVNFVMKGDKYRLGLDLNGFFENIDRVAQKSIELLPDFMGYTKTQQTGGKDIGIRKWRVYKYLNRLRAHKRV